MSTNLPDNARLLLGSSSNVHGYGYLEHLYEAFKELYGKPVKGKVILFFPFASAWTGWDAYEQKVAAAFANMGYQLISAHRVEGNEFMRSRGLNIFDHVQGFFVGGGNTFRLLKTLGSWEWLQLIHNFVTQGMPYAGTSAGAILACPTIRTTNDMPIVEPKNLTALNFLKFQLNCHFVPGALVEGHKGETREQRILEYHEENDYPVIGLPEANWLVVQNGDVILKGLPTPVIFEKNEEPRLWHRDDLCEGTVAGTSLMFD